MVDRPMSKYLSFQKTCVHSFVNWCGGVGDTRGKGKHDKACFYYFEDKCRFRLLCWGVPHVRKVLVVGQSNGSF